MIVDYRNSEPSSFSLIRIIIYLNTRRKNGNCRKIENLSDYISKVKNLHNCLGINDELYFRGQDQKYLKKISLNSTHLEILKECDEKIIESIVPSLFRKEKFVESEDKLYINFLMQAPDLFAHCNNNFERLALMQHHQLPTRLLDLTTNPLIALFFSCSNPNENGVVYPFSNRLNFEIFKNNLELLDKQNILDDFKDIGESNNIFLTRKVSIRKSAFSDEVELESTIVRMSPDDKQALLNEISRFFALRSEHLRNTTDRRKWNEVYYENKSRNSLNDIEYYRSTIIENLSMQHLYYMITNDIGVFKRELNPIELYLPKIVKPRVIDERIRNQKGLFLFVPFVGEVNYTDYHGAVFNNYDAPFVKLS
ncbi:FRG domain-containing protein [Limosilactobacillus sp. Lr3000]|uniref:FRG domain-containing protein n=1 Tax=Limosilactobacillus albertensis TaxID=2759752 RepID=A0A839H317_9LACO|nr:FRG domain-containing protein [Limosilactobacillus albertensis]MBB1124301.1 FRG domain-containing protein [Limosilactobacillus albertensis]